MSRIKINKKLLKVSLDTIVPYENNPRKNDNAVGAVTKSIEQTGYNNPIIVDENMVILAGHTRLKSLKKLGRKEAEVIQVTGLNEDQKKKYRLLDNKTSEYASWDYMMLERELKGIDWGDLQLDWGVVLDDSVVDSNEPRDNSDGSDTSADEEKEETFDYECPECGYKFNI